MRRFFNKTTPFLPQTVQNLGERVYNRLPLSIRYGSKYRHTLRFLLESQDWTMSQHEDFQLKSLQSLVDHAVKNVPFYRERYKKAGISAEDIQSITDIQLLPLVSKDDLRSYMEEMKAQNYPSSAFQYHTTGGSTAKPVGLYWEANRTVPMEKAFMKRQFGWIGYAFEKDRVVNIRGIPPSNGQIAEIVGGNHLRLSSYQMTQDTLDKYIELVQDFKPKVLHAYPSTAIIFAKHLLEKKIELPSIKIVLCGSEQFFDWQREVLKEAFQARIYSWYGQSEYVALAGECEYSTEYHFYSEYGITEILNKDGTVTNPGNTGEIVATGFLNYAFPLIRYKMEDLATISTIEHCQCGRPYRRVSKIDGRIQEMIVGKKGNLVSMTAINMHNSVFDKVWQFQFQQKKPGQIILNIIPKVGYNETDQSAIMQALYLKLGDQFDVSINLVNSIKQTHRGKTSFLVQDLPITSMM